MESEKIWSHDDPLTPRFQNGWCLQKMTLHGDSKKDHEIYQSDALRIIFKKTIMDKVSIDDLRKISGVTSIEKRHVELMEWFYGRAFVSNNPLIMLMFEKYKRLRKRSYFDQNIVVK